MAAFRINEEVLGDIDTIWVYIFERTGLAAADQIVSAIYRAFYRISETPNMGHRRADLTRKEVLFVTVYSFLIVYRRDERPVAILAVLHGKRNVSRLLRGRL